MHAAAASPQPHRMLQVQHLVIDEVFHGESRHIRAVKDPADHNGIVSGIVMPKALTRRVLAPCHLWPREQSVKKTRVKVFEDAVEVVDMSAGGSDTLSSANLADEVRFVGQLAAG